jgi:predicted metalloendopeptidase
MSQSGLGLPNPDYYDDEAVQKVYVEVVRSAVTDVYAKSDKPKTLKGARKPTTPVSHAKEIFEFEKKLAAAFVDR